MIEFKKITEKTVIYDPEGNVLEQMIEQRIDPLTGSVASINTFLGEKAKAFLGTSDINMMLELQEKTKENCPFCNVFQKGAKYRKDFNEEGFFRKNNSVAIPNLFSKCTFDSVIIINHKNHTLFPKKIDVEDFGSAINLAKEIILKARNFDSELMYHVLGMNFLNPGGSSVPHPHFQLHIRKVPYSGVTRLIELSKGYFERFSRNYWEVLIEEEKKLDERFLFDIGDTSWIASFAPQHQKEIVGIISGKSCLADITEKDVESFAIGISKIISFYEDINLHPFTLAFYSSPNAYDRDFFNLQVRICSRPAFKQLYSNYDTWFAPKFIGDEAHTEAPEVYARKIKENIKK